MAATIGVATQFQPYRTTSTGQATQPMNRNFEKASQTFLQGTPVQIDVAGATGFLIACPAMTNVATAIIAGISAEPGANLTTSGVAQTQNLTYKVPNQPNAVVTPIGAPPNDGTSGFILACDWQTFSGLLGDSNTAANATLTQAKVGTIMGLTQDATTLFWYVDEFKNTTATGACVEVVSNIDPIGTLNGRVEFRILRAAQQLEA